MAEQEKEEWSITIDSRNPWFNFKFRELLEFKYLVFMFIKRDFTSMYKQTILGPLWFILQPLLTSGIFSIVFSQIAKIPTDTIPQPIFYLAGSVLWTYFSAVLNSNSQILANNSNLFGKVYFPRFAIPISTAISQLYKFGIQLALFLTVYLIFLFAGAPLKPNFALFLVPLALVQLGLLGLGVGLFSSAITVKYRDLTYLIQFGVGLWMYISPIVYPMSLVTNPVLKILFYLNPVSWSVELFRFSFTSLGTFDIFGWIFSWALSLIIFLVGLAFFNHYQRVFIDHI